MPLHLLPEALLGMHWPSLGGGAHEGHPDPRPKGGDGRGDVNTAPGFPTPPDDQNTAPGFPTPGYATTDLRILNGAAGRPIYRGQDGNSGRAVLGPHVPPVRSPQIPSTSS